MRNKRNIFIIQGTIELDKGGINAASIRRANAFTERFKDDNICLIQVHPADDDLSGLRNGLIKNGRLKPAVNFIQPPSFQMNDSKKLDWLTGYLKEYIKKSEEVVLINEDHHIFDDIKKLHEALPKIKLVQVLHNNHLDIKSGKIKPAYDLMFNAWPVVDLYVTLTHAQRNDILFGEGRAMILRRIPMQKITKISNIFPDEMKTENLDRNQVTVFTRYNRNQKGLEHFLSKIMPLVVTEAPDIIVKMYGALNKPEENSDATKFQSIVSDIGLEKNVEIHDYVEDNAEKYKIMSKTLFTVLPPNYEGMPISTLEMSSAHVPTIAYDVKYGPSELIVDSETGYLVKHGDYEQFAEKMITLWKSPALAEYFGDKSYEDLSRRYNETSIMGY